jgi:hypothetical protein
MASVSLLWQGLFVWLGVFLAIAIRRATLPDLHQWLPVGLLGLFLYWQTMPLVTLSTGWSLQLGKLQIYPVSSRALFSIEAMLRLTSSPEAIIVLVGGIVGLMRHPGVPGFAPLCLFLFVPLNLLLQLAVRDFVAYAFDRSRFREALSALVIAIGVLPQLIIRTGIAPKFKPQFLALANGVVAPWQDVASLSLGHFSWLATAFLIFWTIVCYVLASKQFDRGLRRDDRFQAGPRSRSTSERASSTRLLTLPACIFGVLVFGPTAIFGRGNHGRGFMSDNFLPIVNLYGLLLLSDALLLNVFGLDRQASQLFFVAPIQIETVLRAKNAVAFCLIALQTVAVLGFVMLIRIHVSLFNVAAGISVSCVVAIFLISGGNLLSVALPRPVDPSSTFRKQSGGRMQLWVLLASLAMLALVAFPFLARWAFEKDWTFFAVLLLEAVIGLIVYRITLESAAARAVRERERIVEALGKGAAVVNA